MNSYSLFKSVVRFHSVSKLCASMLRRRPYSTDLFLTRSSAKRSLLFAIVSEGDGKDEWSFFSLRQLQNPYNKSSLSTVLVAAAEFHVELDMPIYHYGDRHYFSYGYTSGLLYFHGASYDNLPLICNPITGDYATLPHLKRYRKSYSFFGFDPIDKQYKVLFMAYPFGPGHHKIITLGTGDMKWRTIKCSLRHDIKSEGICINGVLYYIADTCWCYNPFVTSCYVIVCFDIRSEKFTYIDIGIEEFCELINYMGKLAMIYREYEELHVWVLEDVEIQNWSKYVYTLRNDKFYLHFVYVAGVTASGEIVFSMYKHKPDQHPFYVFYFNPKRNDLRCVEIQGFGEMYYTVYTFVDHLEDLNVNDPQLLDSFHTPYEEIDGYESYTDSE